VSECRQYSAEELGQITLQNNRLFCHNIFQVNYTTYDVQHAQDCMNPRVHADVMALPPMVGDCELSDQHPFVYVRILGVFHADVIHVLRGLQPIFKAMEILWVRWFWYDARWKAGLKHRRLHRVHFVPDMDSDAYGFLDPDEVIHGAHLILAYAHGHVDGEWKYFYVNS